MEEITKTVIEAYFKRLKEECLPGTVCISSGNFILNPAIEICISFILKTVRSINNNDERDSFLLLWMDFTRDVHNGFQHHGVHELYPKQSIKDEPHIQEKLGEDLEKIKRRPEGFLIFYAREFNKLLFKIDKAKSEEDWHRNVEIAEIRKKNLFLNPDFDTPGDGLYCLV